MKKRLKLFGVCVWCTMLCVCLGSCAFQDAALSIPIGSTADESTEIIADELSKSGDAKELASLSVIYVHVCGAVQNPGVVVLPEGSRVADALQEAGGFSEDAQEDYMNLAAKLNDGERLYFPSEEEAQELKEAEKLQQKGLVNLNTADEESLCTLSGIGSARARDIIAYREANGGFARKEDIMNVPGIKESTYNKICDKLIVE